MSKKLKLWHNYTNICRNVYAKKKNTVNWHTGDFEVRFNSKQNPPSLSNPLFKSTIVSSFPPTQKQLSLSLSHTHTYICVYPSIYPLLPQGVSEWPTFPYSTQTTQQQKGWCLVSSLGVLKVCQQKNKNKMKMKMKKYFISVLSTLKNVNWIK